MDLKPTILIVDSASENLMAMKAVLRNRYTVRMAASGAGAVQQLETAPRPELVLLDESLADMEGYAVLHAMRASFLTADIPVLMLSGSAEAFGGRRALEEPAVLIASSSGRVFTKVSGSALIAIASSLRRLSSSRRRPSTSTRPMTDRRSIGK